MVVILIPSQIFIGGITDVHINKYQPIKTAAMQGVWDQKGAPLLLFAIPSNKQQKNLFEIGIP